jgi:peptidylprolyl isomerase
MELKEGMQLQLTNPNGQPVPAMVAKIGDESVTMDVNHPMAGKTLVFDIEIVEIE